MAWRISFRPSAVRELGKLPSNAQRRILEHLEERRRDPRGRGARMRVGRGGRPLWRYRVGACRVICYLRDQDQTVLVLRVAHRREAYR